MVELREAGREAALLWFVALHECAALNEGAGCDGLLTPLVVKDAAHLYDLNAKRAVAKLVESGLWHDARSVTTCTACMDHGGERVGAQDAFIHEWWERLLPAQGKRDPIVRKREQRRKALNNDFALVAAVRERDQDRCRYCGIATDDSSGQNKRGKSTRQLDHVDPWGDNTLENVVVACRTCNGRKRDSTPVQARMTLWAPGTTAEQIRARTAIAWRGPASQPDPAGSPPDPADTLLEILPAASGGVSEAGRAG